MFMVGFTLEYWKQRIEIRMYVRSCSGWGIPSYQDCFVNYNKFYPRLATLAKIPPYTTLAQEVCT